MIDELAHRGSKTKNIINGTKNAPCGAKGRKYLDADPLDCGDSKYSTNKNTSGFGKIFKFLKHGDKNLII